MHVYDPAHPRRQTLISLPPTNSTTYSDQVEETVDELNARTAICGWCHAPARALCHEIRWSNGVPRIVSRKYHARRLKDALRTEELRLMLNARAKREEEQAQREQDQQNAWSR